MREFFTYLPWYRVQAVQLDVLSFFVFGNLHCTVYTVQYNVQYKKYHVIVLKHELFEFLIYLKVRTILKH